MTAISNDNVDLTPHIPEGVPSLEFDFPALRVGVAEYREGPTGCTVFWFPEGVMAAADIRGGSYSNIYTDQLVTGDMRLDAICLAGGSIYGLEAATGASAELFAMREHSTEWTKIALVAGAIIFDYGRRKNAIYPDKALGRAAFKAARTGVFPLGAHGAGCSASVGKGLGFERGEPSGQGGAFRQIGPTKIAVFTVVNAVGAIVDREGRVVRGHLDAESGQREHHIEGVNRRLAAPVQPPPGNTTLTVVVTNQKLAPRSLRQIGRQVHASMSRGIQPFQTYFDGDILYTVTTGEVENPALEDVTLGSLASEVAWDAILNCFER